MVENGICSIANKNKLDLKIIYGFPGDASGWRTHLLIQET